ncbi:MAG: hypothetical protein IJA19_04345 [Clostridia bacterium]|nr:hypothetical protein [Clostridia bacterium]
MKLTKEGYLGASQVANALDISVITLSNWYRWWKTTDTSKLAGVPPLPDFEQDGPRAPRYWKEEDLDKLREFQKWVPKGRNGLMGEVSKRFWSNKK